MYLLNFLADVLIEPAQLSRTQHENATQDQLGDPLSVGLRVGEGQRAAPGTAEDLPAFDAQVLPKPFDIRHEVPGRVVVETGVWRAAATAALVEQDDPVAFRVPEAPHVCGAAAAGTAVQENGRLSGVVAALFVVEGMAAADVKTPGGVRLDRRIERPSRAVRHHGGIMRGRRFEYHSY